MWLRLKVKVKVKLKLKLKNDSALSRCSRCTYEDVPGVRVFEGEKYNALA
jgi:hypothetical protein